MKDKEKVNYDKVAQKSLNKVLQEGGQPSVENLMLALNQAKVNEQNNRNTILQMKEALRDLQIRLVTTEFQHRLEFLWKVMFTEGSINMFGADFISQCAEEFKYMMFPPAEETKEQEKEENNG